MSNESVQSSSLAGRDLVNTVIWQGIYNSFEEAGAEQSVFVHEAWIDRSVQRLRASYAESASVTTTIDADILVGPILAMSSHSRCVKVLDVGGNLGQLGLAIKGRLPSIGLDWMVLERADFLAACAEVISTPAGLEFFSRLEDLSGKQIDVLHFGSSIQYLDDWEAFLKSAVKSHSPEWIVISDAMAGDNIRSFVTRQTYYDGYLVSRFFNTSDLDEVLSRAGYGLEYRAIFLNERNKGYYPALSLPEEFRIPYPLNLIYRLQPS